MLAYQNDPELKKAIQKAFEEHRKAPEASPCVNRKNKLGCSVDCLMSKDQSFTAYVGPAWLERLVGAILDGLPASEGAEFGTVLLDAIPVGVDVAHIRYVCAHARLKRLSVLVKPGIEALECRRAIARMLAYCEAALAGKATEAMRGSAEKAAWVSVGATRDLWVAEWKAALMERATSRNARTKEYRLERDTLLEALYAVEG